MNLGPLVGPMRANDELRGRTAAHVGFKNFVRVVQVRNNQIELGKIIGQVRGERLLAEARSRQESKDPAGARAALSEAERRVPDDPEVARLEAGLDIESALASSGGSALGGWLEAAGHLERAVALDPYRQLSWTQLAVAYRRLGMKRTADEMMSRAAAYRVGS